MATLAEVLETAKRRAERAQIAIARAEAHLKALEERGPRPDCVMEDCSSRVKWQVMHTFETTPILPNQGGWIPACGSHLTGLLVLACRDSLDGGVAHVKRWEE